MKIKTASTLSLAAALVSGVSCQRVLQEVAEIGFDISPSGATSGDEGTGSSTAAGTADLLIAALEGDEQVSVVGPVELGTLSCNSLANAANAAAVGMTIHGERIVADQTSYTLVDGGIFDDGISRHVWTGEVSDPEQAEDEAVPRTVSLSWGEECSVETFLLKITKRNIDGSTSMVKTVPCIDDSENQTCLVEVLVEFEEPGEVLLPEVAGDSSTSASSGSSRRRMQEGGEGEYTEIDVMVLYTEAARAVLGGVTHQQMITTIVESLVWTNQAFINSEVAVRFKAVLIGPAPFEETDTGGIVTLNQFMDTQAVKDMRDAVEADLVQLIGYFNDGFCGWGYTAIAEQYGFSIVKPTCLDNYIHTHEYGHNFGCFHNRENSIRDTEYSHGLRYCSGIAPYRTIMSYGCGSPYGNYFSNPDVTYLGRPTGTPTEDNARTIEDNMVSISNFRGQVMVPPTPAPVVPTTEPPTVPPTMPPTMAPYTEVTHTAYAPVGCYGDSNGDRVLTGDFVKNDGEMTTEKCAMLCEGYEYFGTEYSTECFCGSSPDDPSRKGPATCNFPCAGDADQTCGGNNAISVYEYQMYPFVGCYKDSWDRVLSGDSTLNDPTMTTAVCAMMCEGSPYFGTEYGSECFCGVQSDDPTELGPGTCNFPCAGDATETCGGNFAISVYTYPDAVIVPTPTFLGCWGDSKGGRIMTYSQTDADMTTDMCQSMCTSYSYFGTQYGVECWCGDEDTDFETYGASSACDFACGGDAGETCGGRNAMSVYEY